MIFVHHSEGRVVICVEIEHVITAIVQLCHDRQISGYQKSCVKFGIDIGGEAASCVLMHGHATCEVGVDLSLQAELLLEFME